MPRRDRPRSGTAPPPLPPETRTVGQLVAEAVRLYGRRFWLTLSLGVGPAVVGLALAEIPTRGEIAFVLTVGAFVLTACYIGGTAIAAGVRLERRSVGVALAAGVLVFLPVPFLSGLLVLPAVAWLALVGLAVPVALIERRGLRGSLGRALQLARADYVHALGSLAALTVLVLLTASLLYFLLLQWAAAAAGLAAFLALVVVSPLLFLGAALLYFDQGAR